MVASLEFGSFIALTWPDVVDELFVWRGERRIAWFRVRPSGRELVAVARTGLPAGSKLPRR